MEKGPVDLGSHDEEGESESKVINQIFGRLQYPKYEVRYLENIFLRLSKRFLPIRGVCHKSYKSKYHSIYKNKNFETRFVRDKHPLHVF